MFFHFRNLPRKSPNTDKKKQKNKKTNTEQRNVTKIDYDYCEPELDSKSYFWRVFCASLPFQFLLLAAVFIAWSFQPKCCEATNSLSLLPQLRYVNGPPPI